jgi:hypothetical protein
MAKANLADLIGSSSNDVSAVPTKPDTRPTAASKPAPAPTAAAPDSADDARINFMIPRELRQKFKAWAAQNDTSIKDELTRHIRSLVD